MESFLGKGRESDTKGKGEGRKGEEKDASPKRGLGELMAQI
jgi:hypothetical protein